MKNNIRVLIVEDSLFLREMLCHIFFKEEIKVVGISSSVKGALLKLKNSKPNIVLVDMVLPQENGTILVHEIQKLYPEIKILVCSSLSQKYLKTCVQNTKNTFFISKPFAYDEIVHSVRSLVHKNFNPEQQPVQEKAS